jgi:hypothetical protein
LEAAGVFIVDTIGILLAGYQDWIIWLFLTICLAAWFSFLWLSNRHAMPESRGRIRKWLLPFTFLALLGWLVAFAVPVTYVRNLLVLEEGARYQGPMAFVGQEMLDDLMGSNTESLKKLYRYDIYVVLSGIFVVSVTRPARKRKKSDPAKTETHSLKPLPQWSKYAHKAVWTLLSIQILLLPAAYGVIAKEPVFPNGNLVIDPEKTQTSDDIFGLNLRFRSGEDFYLLYKDGTDTYVYNTVTLSMTRLNTSSVYVVEYLPEHGFNNILQHVNRKKAQTNK